MPDMLASLSDHGESLPAAATRLAIKLGLMQYGCFVYLLLVGIGVCVWCVCVFVCVCVCPCLAYKLPGSSVTRKD